MLTTAVIPHNFDYVVDDRIVALITNHLMRYDLIKGFSVSNKV